MAKFLVTFQWGEMGQDRESICEARRALVRWAAKAESALVDIGAPIRSTSILTRHGIQDGDATAAFMGWSVIDAPDYIAAVDLLQDHPLIGLGALLQISEPI